MGVRANPLGWPTWGWLCLVATAITMAAYGLVQGVTQVIRIFNPTDRDFVADALLDAGGALFALFAATCLITVAIGVFVFLRGRHHPAAVLLGVVLLAWAPSSAFAPPPWGYPSDSPGYTLRWLADLTRITTFATVWPLFCLELAGGRTRGRQARWVTTGALMLGFVSVALGLLLMADPSRVDTAVGSGVLLTHIAVTQGSGFAILVWNIRQADAASRNRVKITILAFAAYLLSFLISNAVPELVRQGNADGILIAAIVSTVLGLGGASLIAYAVLRQKLFDLSFALNRTLVYGTVSLVLLLAFGAAKWVIEHLIPAAWDDGSEYYSFAIALALFLLLHRVHTWVERNVERVFFATWHRNEAALRRFVAAAGHFEQSGELCRAFAEEMRRFAGGAGSAIYRRDRGGAYALQQGALDGALAQYPADDLALALMRAERGAVRLGGVQTALPGTLALPMLDHGRLSGFALLDRKADGSDYRPDEVDVLGRAAQQVGLDVQTMHVGELEAELAGLSAQLAVRDAQVAASRAKRRQRREAPA